MRHSFAKTCLIITNLWLASACWSLSASVCPQVSQIKQGTDGFQHATSTGPSGETMDWVSPYPNFYPPTKFLSALVWNNTSHNQSKLITNSDSQQYNISCYYDMINMNPVGNPSIVLIGNNWTLYTGGDSGECTDNNPSNCLFHPVSL